MKTSSLCIPALLAALFIIGNTAFAQTPYVWIDEKGVKQFSDQPPPPSIPKNKILKYSGKAVDASQDSLPDADSSDAAKTPKPAESLADKEVAYKKRHDEMAAKDKKAQEDAKAATTKADNCKRMQEYKATLESGQRVGQTDASGTRSYMTDDQRSQQLGSLSQSIGDCSN